MENYAVYINESFGSYNIFDVSVDDIACIQDAYRAGKPEFFMNGKRYYMRNLNEIKIINILRKEEFDKVVEEHTERISSLSIDDLNMSQVISVREIKQFGEDVTGNFIKGDYGKGDSKNMDVKEVVSKMEIEVFISHSSEDIEKVKALINIIGKALNIKASQIRCTSVEGYKLPGGASTEEQLKKEIFSSKVFVAVITEHSVVSTFVLFELGARWSTGQPLMPLICDPKGVNLLTGPLKNINALNGINSSDILQFIEDLAKKLGVDPSSASSYLEEVTHLKELIEGDSDFTKVYRKAVGQEHYNGQVKEDEYIDSDVIIKKNASENWSNNYSMQVDEIKRQREAVEYLKRGKPADLTNEEFNGIRERAKKEWPDNYIMQKDEIERQIVSLRLLKEI